MRKLMLPLSLLLITCFLAGCCIDNSDCPSSYYCVKEVGDCKGIGTCAEKPKGCPEIYAPVCGCNYITYDNDCEAAAFEVNVLHEGECSPPPSCIENFECSFGEYCLKSMGDCEGEGVCSEKPQLCLLYLDPVCGCDGKIYGNACEAAAAGVNETYDDVCAN